MNSATVSHRQLGRRLKAHPLGVGCRSIGTGHREADEEALRGLRRAVAAGATLFDTADTYGGGRSERLIGQLLHEHRGAGLQVISKIGTAGSAPHPYASPHMRHQLEQTLDNLRDEHIAVFTLPSLDFGPGDRYLHEAADQMDRFRRLGTVGAIGLRGPHPSATGQTTADRFAEVFDVIRPDIVLTRFSPLTPTVQVAGEDLFSFTERRGAGLLLYSPLAGGQLAGCCPGGLPAGSDASRRDAIITRGLEPLRERFGDTPGALAGIALQHCLRQGGASAVLAGFRREHHIAQNYAALTADPFTPDDLAYAEQVYTHIRGELELSAHATAAIHP